MNKKIDKNTDNTLYPIFPLSVFILPGGKARLRIFEAKYLKMLSLISTHQKFVIQLDQRSSFVNKKSWGSLVEIKDFNQGEDRVLEIDVECTTLVHCSPVNKYENDLMLTTINPFKHWSQYALDNKPLSIELSNTLNEIMNNDAMLNQLYPHRALKNIHWVIARWIELLPVKASMKSHFISANSFTKANQFVESVIFK